MSLVDQAQYQAADAEGRKAMLERHRPTATRHVFLIRHGQYHLESDKKNLTPLGREQAQLLGERLAKTGIKYDVCVMSTMNRWALDARPAPALFSQGHRDRDADAGEDGQDDPARERLDHRGGRALPARAPTPALAPHPTSEYCWCELRVT